ncbi:MAG: IS701 family transposase, partial [Trueperaceae bacterium]|nr:IS701 family transposase [Trueperaceae bacterium]
MNYTQTYLAEHSERYSHDSINRFLRLDVLTPGVLWNNVKKDVVESEKGYLMFDDMVLDKRHSQKARLVRRQWSGNEKRIINGIGVVSCVYVNPELEQFWIIDYRLYDPEGDGQTKIAHMLEMLENVLKHKKLSFKTVLMDTWYASMQVIKHIESLGKLYYCPIKTIRKVNDSSGDEKHKRVDSLSWSEEEQLSGKLIHLHKMPKGHQVKLFRLGLSTKRT